MPDVLTLGGTRRVRDDHDTWLGNTSAGYIADP